MFAPIYPLLEFEVLPEFVDRIKGYASMAIKHYFGDDVTKIVKINAGGGRDFTYYITFKIDNEGNEDNKDSNLQAQNGLTC
ncbi:hypothetical protein RND71_022771 [Anisodus tanguticus]|uniref:Uncharacterized protein n=1 Tax=Anisodus tanguticus TaxID=243964 RepID=A0AAE1VB13_9SOLA|nr:hypothetical protein RND71_022771 [Anisodus tanguticus]